MMRLFGSILFLFAIALPITVQTNLPNVAPGVFDASARIEINTTVDSLWNAIVDFAAYPNWNPFVRLAIVTNELGVPLPSSQQYPVENKRILFRVQIPPLPFPVDASTPDNPLHTQVSFENITHVQRDLGRVAWVYLAPDVALNAERWTSVSQTEDGRALYESREVYRGLLAPTLEALYKDALNEAFVAQAQALKMLLEG